jgi:hypothetical protein
MLTPIVLLFVLWYCHKRGREVRLEKERMLTEQEVQRLEKEYAEMHPGDVHTTTAPEGASIEEVKVGMMEVKEARERAAAVEAAEASDAADASKAPAPSTHGTTVQPAEHAEAS